jgi:hypothetical protein
MTAYRSVTIGNPDTACASGERSYVTVVTSGQRKHAAPPSWENHRQSYLASGPTSATGGRGRMMSRPRRVPMLAAAGLGDSREEPAGLGQELLRLGPHVHHRPMGIARTFAGIDEEHRRLSVGCR